MIRKIVFTVAVASVAIAAVPAHAGGWGGWGGKNSNSYSSGGLINVSPTVRTGNVSLLNGTSLLNKSPIASGNVISGILSGNSTGIANGLLGGNRLGILGGNTHTSKYSIGKGRR